ncbi:hypothetical protein HCN44_007985 [Aphidius gifuensis]|uniref:F-box domain-containing protein n=1 Tax=Aphidius gifuensis TaxID=684658 RepID=A0A834XR19_APHGI|nr:uncharacterized protein LOC122857655 [Aphidius gifuensis]KAF7989311.1 hypothetical protein HCN44_007985 [Aphidius gifuensis]
MAFKRLYKSESFTIENSAKRLCCRSDSFNSFSQDVLQSILSSSSSSSSSQSQHDNNNNTSLIDKVNLDCLGKIFEYLNFKDRLMMEKICIKWRDASDYSWNMKNLDCTYPNICGKYGQDPVDQQDIEKILTRSGSYLKKLKIDSKICQSSVMIIVGDYCRNLINLQIELLYYDKDDFNNVFEQLDKLEKIKIILLDNKQCTQNSYYRYDLSILQSLPSTIKKIIWQSNSLISWFYFDKKFTQKFDNFNALCCLSLEMCHLDKKVMKMLLKKQTITCLVLKYCKLEKEISCKFKLINLEYLDLSYSRSYYSDLTIDDLIYNVTTNSKKLKYLNIEKCQLKSKYVLYDLGKLKNLETLILNNLPDVNDDVIKGFKNLQVLNCKNCKGVTDTGIIMVLQHCDYLKNLQLEGTKITVEALIFASSIVDDRSTKINMTINVDEELMSLFFFDDKVTVSSYFNITCK